jgi:hypothetical protein
MKRITVFCIISLCAASVCFGQTNQTESLTIATYYPSPTGVYSTLRLSPANNPPIGAYKAHGVLYYNSTEDTIKYYNKTDVWVNLTSGMSTGGYWAYNSSTQDINNTNVTSNGTVVINGVDASADVLKVYGDMRIKGQANDDAIFYIVRRSVTNSSGLRFFTNESPYEDQYKLWLTGNPGFFAIGNKSVNFLEVERNTGKLTIGGAIDADGGGGMEGNTYTPKLHIIGNTTGASPDQTFLRLEGDGEIILAMRSASSGAYIYPMRAHGSHAAPSSLLANDSIFFIKGYGYNGTGYNTAASIQMLADRNYDTVNVPLRYSFNTTPAGSTIPVERMVLKVGKVGIGESDPQFALQVRYKSTLEGHVNSTTGQWEVSSDKRFKKNISGIEDALEKVLRVKGIRYDPLTEKHPIAKKGRHFGFIGQDLETVDIKASCMEV